MKFCSKCGKEIMDDAVICPHCGCAQENHAIQAHADSSSFGWAFVGFCIPLVGLILYLVWKDNTPLKAKSAGKGALVGVITSVVLYVLFVVVLGAALGTAATDLY